MTNPLPAWAARCSAYDLKHAQCDHAWGRCDVKRDTCDCTSYGLKASHYSDCPLAE